MKRGSGGGDEGRKEEGAKGGTEDGEQTMDGGVNGGEEDVAFAYRRSTPQRHTDKPISLISQPLVG